VKLAAKIVLIFLVGAVILLVIDGVFAAQREQRLFDQDARADVELLGKTMQKVVGDVWRRHGKADALRLIGDINRLRPAFSVNWIWVQNGSSGQRDRRFTSPEIEQLEEGQNLYFRHREYFEGSLRSYFPVRLSDGRLGAIELVENLGPLKGATRATLIRIGALTLGLSMLATILAVPFGMRVVGRPLKSLVDKTRRIGQDDFSNPLRLSGHDELTELAESLNAMCDQLTESRRRLLQETEARVAALEQLRHEDRLRTVGRLASGVAHELGTPLNVVQGRAGMIASRRLSSEEVLAAAEIIKTQTETMTGIVRQLLDFARRQVPDKVDLRPDDLVREVVDLLRPLARKIGATLRVKGGENTGKVCADPTQIRQVLINLVMNGLQAIERPGTVDIEICRKVAVPPEGVEAEAGEYLCFSVEDDGEGISDEDAPNLFEPFFTTKDVGEGTGLGLAIAYGIVREHGGWIEMTSELGAGSRFEVFLPLEARA